MPEREARADNEDIAGFENDLEVRGAGFEFGDGDGVG